MINSSDVELLLRGWKDSGSRLRVKLESDSFLFMATCTIREISLNNVALQISKDDSFEFDLRDFAFDFMDADPSDNQLAIGETIESVIIGASSWGKLFLVLLK